MRDPLSLLGCPHCGGALLHDQHREGVQLRCAPCGKVYVTTDGIHRMVDISKSDAHSAATFGSQWKMRAEGRFEKETLYGFSPEQHLDRFLRGFGIQLDELAGKTVLDAGCGTALLAQELAPHVEHVVAVDLTTEMGADASRPLHPNLTLAQGDVLQLPVQEQVFDFVWSAGVIHTTPDPKRGFQQLVRSLAPGGKLYVWVDNKNPNPIQRLHAALPRLSPRLLYGVSRTLAIPAALAVNLTRSERYQRPMSVGRAAFLIHDHLASSHAHRFDLEDLTGWCAELDCLPPTDVSEDAAGLAIRTERRA